MNEILFKETEFDTKEKSIDDYTIRHSRNKPTHNTNESDSAKTNNESTTSGLSENTKAKIAEQHKKMRLEISSKIDRAFPYLALEKKYNMREAMFKVKVNEDLNWAKDIGISETVINQLEEIVEVEEKKKLVNHSAFEGRIKSGDKTKIKNALGYDCMACGGNMGKKFGDIGKNYIELHHKIPYADMLENDTRTLAVDDFCVLCPNCHRMIHRLDNAGDIELLKNIISLNEAQE